MRNTSVSFKLHHYIFRHFEQFIQGHTQVPRSLSRHHHRSTNGDGHVSVRAALPWEEHQLSLVQVELQVVRRQAAMQDDAAC